MRLLPTMRPVALFFCVQQLMLAMLFSASVSAQSASALAVTGANGEQKSLTSELIAVLPGHQITATSHNETFTYNSVALIDMLRHMGLVPADKLTREHMTLVVEVISRDGYRVAFSLAELDPAIGQRAVYLAHSTPTGDLPAAMGAFRLVVPDDGRHARWVWDVLAVNIRQL